MQTTSRAHSDPSYNYRHVRPKVLLEDMVFSDAAPQPGNRLPRFDLPLVDGGRLHSRDLLQDKPVLLFTGSFTCPMTASSNPLLKELFAEFGGDVRFVMLHVREAHPGEQRDQAQSADQKMQHARDLKQRDGLPWRIVVDDTEGTIHRALDEKPNAAYLVDASGEIVFRSLWAGDQAGLREALESVANGRRPDPAQSTRCLVPMARGVGVMREMLQQAGPRAEHDMWRSAPPMALLARVADLYRPLRPEWRTFAAMATIGAIAVVAVKALRGHRHHHHGR